jgi:hypothetical protein
VRRALDSATYANLGTCAYSLCILSSICKSLIGPSSTRRGVACDTRQCLVEANSELSWAAYDMRPGTTPKSLYGFLQFFRNAWLIPVVAQERPCARCIKRNIGHLCHDERRETETAAKKSKTQNSGSIDDEDIPTDQSQQAIENGMSAPYEQRPEQVQENSLGLSQVSIPHSTGLQIVQPSPVSRIQANALNSNSSHCK